MGNGEVAESNNPENAKPQIDFEMTEEAVLAIKGAEELFVEFEHKHADDTHNLSTSLLFLTSLAARKCLYRSCEDQVVMDVPAWAVSVVSLERLQQAGKTQHQTLIPENPNVTIYRKFKDSVHFTDTQFQGDLERVIEGKKNQHIRGLVTPERKMEIALFDKFLRNAGEIQFMKYCNNYARLERPIPTDIIDDDLFLAFFDHPTYWEANSKEASARLLLNRPRSIPVQPHILIWMINHAEEIEAKRSHRSHALGQNAVTTAIEFPVTPSI